MSTLRVSNIEAKADASSPTVNEKLKVTNSNGDVLIHVNGETSGITTIGINTTGESVRFDSNQNATFAGIVTAGSIIIPDISTNGFSPSHEIKIWPGNKSYSSSTNSIAIGGTGTLMLNTQGDLNVAIGNEAMVHNTSGDENVCIGFAAGSNITTSDKNVAVGAYAIGYWGTYTGNNNTAVGSESLLGLTTGDDNTAVGQAAGDGIAEGDDNVAIGSNCLRDCYYGNGNIAIGYRAGKGIYDGSNNIIIGNNKAENTLPDDLSSTVIVSCGVTERLRINSAGLVGIGTTNPEYDLDFGESPSTIRLVSENNGTTIRIGAGSNSNQVTLLRVDGSNPGNKGTSNDSDFGFSVKYMGNRSGNNNSLSIFGDNQNGATQVEAITINQDGSTGIGTDNPAEILTVAGNVRVQNSADVSQYLNLTYQGIDFQNTGAGSSTTATSHLLDDYEEGTWTPTYLGTTGNPTITYVVQQGVYTKIGNTVHCQGRLQTSAASGGSGVVLVGNFPFECKTGNDRGVLNIGYSNDWVTQAPQTGHMENGGVRAFLRYFSGTGTPTIIVGSNLKNVGAGDNDLMFDVTYEVV